jgi:hypothetical protein
MSERVTLGNGDFIAVSAIRYALGRMTYIVGDTVAWLMYSWPLLDEGAKKIITRDLSEAIELDARIGAGGGWAPLGMDTDRREWLRLRDFIAAYEKA